MACYSSAWWQGCYDISGYKFGQSDADYKNGVHPGTDFGLPNGTPLYAGGNGQVVYAGSDPFLGNMLKIRLNNGTEVVLGHLSSLNVGLGPVAQGQLLGQSGATGNASGPHLHMEVHPNGGAAIDPVGWLASGGASSGGTQPVAGINLDIAGAISNVGKNIVGGATNLSLYVGFFLLGLVLLIFALRAMTAPEPQEAT